MFLSSTLVCTPVFGVPGGSHEWTVGSDGGFLSACGYSENLSAYARIFFSSVGAGFATSCGHMSRSVQLVDAVQQSQSSAWMRTFDLSRMTSNVGGPHLAEHSLFTK